MKKNKLHPSGRILEGNEYLTVFSGLTGDTLHYDYIPAVKSQDWGDTRTNHSDRFLLASLIWTVIRPSV